MKRTKRDRPQKRASIPQTHPARPHLASPLIAAALITIAVALVYSTALDGPFVFDDRGTIIDNRTIEHIWSADVLKAPHETPTAGRPVVNVSFAINYAFGRRDVTGYHLANIAIHLLSALTVFAVARRAQPSAHAALAIALLWAVHPLNSEAVNYVTQRTELLMALFYLLTLYCAIRAHAGHAARRWEAAAVVACVLGMASKESMVTAPVAVALYDRVFHFQSWKEAFRARRRLYAGLAASWGVLALCVVHSPRNLSAGFSTHDADVWTYLLNQAVMITRYLRLSFWPHGLVLYYGWPVRLTLGEVHPETALILSLLVLTVVALLRAPRLGLLGAWFFLVLAPTSSIVPIATEVGAERRMYLPLIAVIALAVFAYRRWVRDQRLRIAALAATTLLLGLATVARTAEYQSSLRLAQTTFERWPTPASHSMLGTELAAAGRLSEAEVHLREAAVVHPPAQYYLATVLAAQGNRIDAIAQFIGFIRRQPPELDQVHLARALLADALSKEGRFDDAAEQYKIMLARADDPQAAVQLAQIFMRQQRFAEAIPLFERALSSRPDDPRTLSNLGIALASTGRLDEAIESFRRALALDPNNTQAQANLSHALSLKKQ